MLPTIGEVTGDKRDLRRAVLERRGRQGRETVATADRARTSLILGRLTAELPVGSVAAYLSERSEPGTAALVAALHAAGVTVLLPRLQREPDWAEFQGPGSVGPGRWGIPEPLTPALGASSLAGAGLIVLPGLLATPEGVRLGRGGGWYDRALLHASPGAPRWLLLNDDEVVDDLPVEAHDQPVTAIVTPTRWIDCGE